MMLNPVQICMDSSDWPQSMMQERGFRPAAASTEDLLSCSRPLLERGLKPQPEQALKCPRCDSTNTKFCYYNNYSLSQPRHFCKTCRRYWTKGGALRTVPVGGGCRKNKKAKRTAVDQAIFSQNEPSTSGAPSSANALSNLNPANNSGSNIFSDINAAAFARAQQQAAARYGDQSALPNCSGSDFLGLSCGPSGTQSSFAPLALNPISSLPSLSALNTLQSLKPNFPGLTDFPVISKTTDQASSSLVPPSDWQLPSETALLDTNINFWTAGSWPDLATYGSSSM